jgi:EipB-like
MTRSLTSPRSARSLALTLVAVGLGLGSGGVASAANAAAGTPFLAHQALYDLSLVKSRGSSSINSARGRILYNFSGSACEGYTSEFRQVATCARPHGRTARARPIASKSTRE